MEIIEECYLRTPIAKRDNSILIEGEMLDRLNKFLQRFLFLIYKNTKRGPGITIFHDSRTSHEREVSVEMHHACPTDTACEL